MEQTDCVKGAFFLLKKNTFRQSQYRRKSILLRCFELLITVIQQAEFFCHFIFSCTPPGRAREEGEEEKEEEEGKSGRRGSRR